MIIYLIRHGHAVDRELWSRSDLERPLTKKGMDRAKTAFEAFFSKYQKPSVIISSKALRASGTADILASMCDAETVRINTLNPGASPDEYHKVVSDFSINDVIAIVGHEPDMSLFISHHLSGGVLACEFKKGSICHIEDGCLVNFVQQKVLL
jgi:phosphohistidine phosphatase